MAQLRLTHEGLQPPMEEFMTKLVINGIINCERNPALGEAFDSHFAAYQRKVNTACVSESRPGELGCIYVQFQFDGDWP